MARCGSLAAVYWHALGSVFSTKGLEVCRCLNHLGYCLGDCWDFGGHPLGGTLFLGPGVCIGRSVENSWDRLGRLCFDLHPAGVDLLLLLRTCETVGPQRRSADPKWRSIDPKRCRCNNDWPQRERIPNRTLEAVFLASLRSSRVQANHFSHLMKWGKKTLPCIFLLHNLFKITYPSSYLRDAIRLPLPLFLDTMQCNTPKKLFTVCLQLIFQAKVGQEPLSGSGLRSTSTPSVSQCWSHSFARFLLRSLTEIATA